MTSPGCLLGGDLQPLPDDDRSGDRDDGQFLGHEAADGLDVVIVDLEVEQLAQVVDWQPRAFRRNELYRRPGAWHRGR